jgi:hypothetical protein
VHGHQTSATLFGFFSPLSLPTIHLWYTYTRAKRTRINCVANVLRLPLSSPLPTSGLCYYSANTIVIPIPRRSVRSPPVRVRLRKKSNDFTSLLF